MGMFSEGTTMYGAAIDMHASNSSYVELLKMVGNGKRVLEVGPGVGHVTKQLTRQGCTVTCIEKDKNMSDMAKEFCAHMIVGDIESNAIGRRFHPSDSTSLLSEMSSNTYEIQSRFLTVLDL